MGLGDRIRNGWNAFMNRDPTSDYIYNRDYYYGTVSGTRPDRTRLLPGNERTIINAIENRIALDVASVKIIHARLDENGRFQSTINSGLNSCMTLSANKDQTGRAFFQDVALSLLDEGCVAVVPVDTDISLQEDTNSYDILTIRVGKILEWRPDHVKVHLYNDRTGRYEDVLVEKDKTAIIENPFYSVMNEPNSILKRLNRKLQLLDAVDEQSNSGKLDLIIQLPYVIKTEKRREQAENRRKEIEMQLTGSKYGIAYTDGTEKVIQLNRSLENNLMAQVEYLTSMLYSQLGITDEILKGTADEKTMLNYNNRVIEPLLSAITDEFKRKFLTPTARTQRQSITFYREPFKLVPVNDLAEIADKFTRNAILSSNELRGLIGFKPVDDPKADELRNKNLNQAEGEEPPVVTDRTKEPKSDGVPVD